MEATSKAYGKILVFGGYSILESGNIGLVVNIDKGTTTTAQETQAGRLIIDLSTFKISIYGKFQGDKLQKINPESINFVKNAVDYTIKYLQHRNEKISDLRLITYNDPEFYIGKKFKAGFGSSATSTVSTVASVLAMHHIEDRELVHKISLYSHYKTQGNLGSGFDISAACNGSHYFISKYQKFEEFHDYMNSKQDSITETFSWPYQLLPVIVFTGKSASTIELISKVFEYKKSNPDEYKKFMQSYNQVNLELKTAFDSVDVNNIKRLLEKSWIMRKHLGKLAKANIEDDKFTRIVNDMKVNGAFFAGLLGAGAGDSILAVCLNEDDKANLIDYLNKRKFKIFENVNLFNQGYMLQ